jgi:hypothetical protein
MNSWIGVDLDGTLAHYEGYGDGKVIGEPIQPMLDRVRLWLAENKKIKIFTARVAYRNEEQRQLIKEWCLKHIGQELEVTCMKDQGMRELWDDRAVSVEKNTGKAVTLNKLYK